MISIIIPDGYDEKISHADIVNMTCSVSESISAFVFRNS
jgi:hypothetical protein